MSCPSCGSDQFVSLGPGLAQCQAVMVIPTGAHPSGAMGPATRQVVCSAQYQVAQIDAPHCQCGMQSVARCTRCTKPVCLQHRRTWSGSVVCLDEYQKLVAQNEQDEQARERELVLGLSDVIGRIAESVEEQPHLGLSHVYHGVNLIEGDACSEHGSPCHVDNVYTKGIFKKPVGAFGRMNVWVLARHGGIGEYVGVNSHGNTILSISDLKVPLQHTWRVGGRLDSSEAIAMFSRDWGWSRGDTIIHFTNVLEALITDPSFQPHYN